MSVGIIILFRVVMASLVLHLPWIALISPSSRRVLVIIKLPFYFSRVSLATIEIAVVMRSITAELMSFSPGGIPVVLPTSRIHRFDPKQ